MNVKKSKARDYLYSANGRLVGFDATTSTTGVLLNIKPITIASECRITNVEVVKEERPTKFEWIMIGVSAAILIGLIIGMIYLAIHLKKKRKNKKEIETL